MSDITYTDPKVDNLMQKVLPWVESLYGGMVDQHGYERGKAIFFLRLLQMKVCLGEEQFNKMAVIGYRENKYLWS